MPQLDQFTYLTQYFWLCVFYMTFYILLYNYGLPKISRILKLRAYLVSQQNKDMHLFGDQNAQKSLVLPTVLKNSYSYLYSSLSQASNWSDSMINNLNSKQWSAMNKSYLSSLGEIGLSQVIKDNALQAVGGLAKTLSASSSGSAITLNRLNQTTILRIRKNLNLLGHGDRLPVANLASKTKKKKK